MSAAVWGALGSIVTLVGLFFAWPKARAEARKLNIESDGLIVLRLYAEIERLDRERVSQDAKIAAQDAKIDQIEISAASEQAELVQENKRLLCKVKRLETRVMAMESVLADVFKAAPNTAEFNALLARIDEEEARLSKKRGRK